MNFLLLRTVTTVLDKAPIRQSIRIFAMLFLQECEFWHVSSHHYKVSDEERNPINFVTFFQVDTPKPDRISRTMFQITLKLIWLIWEKLQISRTEI